MSEISKDELALYDRQIRLWGLEAQKKLREGCVLVISTNMNLIVQEICKNLALCGIASLKLALISEESFGTLIYSSLESELKDIHPRLKFECTNDSEVTEFDQFDFVIACGHPYQIDYPAINESARKFKTCNISCFEAEDKFFLFNDFGEFTVNASSGPKTIQFPSFASVLQNIPRNLKEKDMKILFYDAMKNPSGQNSIQYGPSKVAGAAIIGALVSQEVIKSFSKTDFPINNMLIFDSQNLKNVVTTVGVISLSTPEEDNPNSMVQCQEAEPINL